MKATRNNSFTKILGTALFLWFSPLSFGQDADLDLDFNIPQGFAALSAAGVNSMEVQSGEAQWATVGNEFQITASDGALIQYFAGFDIPAGETVRFIQPSADATVINEIVNLELALGAMGAASQIDGNLFANGKVVLFNSAGIVFGETSVVEVGKLHAIAGTDLARTLITDLTRAGIGYSLTGAVTAAGSITAGEVVLAGTSVTNSGIILVEGGTLVMAAGAGMQLTNEDNSLIVDVSTESPVFGAADLAGQALLQSGVVQASKAEFVANVITHSGTTTATSMAVSGFSTFAGNEGTLKASTLAVTGSDPENAPDFSASGTNNQVSQLTLSGSHDDFTLRSSTSLVEGTAPLEDPQVGLDLTTHSVQNLDLRVDNGDLTVNSLFAPVDANTDNSLLLAAENNLALAAGVDSYTHARTILYGRNLSAGAFDDAELSLGATVSLDAQSVFIDDLSPSLSSTVIQALALDNPDFEGFDSEGGLIELNALTSDQLEQLLELGFFTGYSYFLQAPDASATLANDFAQLGGSSAIYGGSYAAASSAGSEGGESDSSSEDSESEESESSGGSGPATPAGAEAIRELGAIPFSPISEPVLSAEAARILEEALTPEIEARLQQYLER